MNKNQLKNKIATDFQALISDIAAAETLESDANPFSTVTFGKDFLKAQLSAPVLSDEELKQITNDIDEAIEQDRSLKEVVGLVSQGLELLAKYGAFL